MYGDVTWYDSQKRIFIFFSSRHKKWLQILWYVSLCNNTVIFGELYFRCVRFSHIYFTLRDKKIWRTDVNMCTLGSNLTCENIRDCFPGYKKLLQTMINICFYCVWLRLENMYTVTLSQDLFWLSTKTLTKVWQKLYWQIFENTYKIQILIHFSLCQKIFSKRLLSPEHWLSETLPMQNLS